MKFADVIQTADWKAEKHVPAITAPIAVKAGEKFVVEVSVGKEIAQKITEGKGKDVEANSRHRNRACSQYRQYECQAKG